VWWFALTCAGQTAALAPSGTLRAAFLDGNPVLGRVDAKTGAVTGPVADLVKEFAVDRPRDLRRRPAGAMRASRHWSRRGRAM